MKSMLLSILTCAWLSLVAQSPITSAAFPSIGDTIKNAIDTSASVDLLTQGGPRAWSFLQLQNHRDQNTIYLAASEGTKYSSFPTADMVTIAQNGSETYYQKTNTQFAVLGYAGPDPANLGLDVVAKFQPPFILQRAPMQFFDVNNPKTSLTLAFSIDQLPDSLFQIPGVDSIRLRLAIDRLDVVDGYGSLDIPGETQTVLREKRTEITSTELDVHAGFLGWFPIPTGGGGGIPSGFLGQDTAISFHYFSNAVNEELAVIDVATDDITVPTRASFKRNIASSIKDLDISNEQLATVFAYPNPAVDEVSFECRNIPNDTYKLQIFNLLGKSIWAKEYPISGNKSIKVDLNEMRKGTYLYSLTNSKGKIISTKRLVVIKP